MIGSAKTYAQKQDGQSGNQLVVSGRDLLEAVGLVRTAIEPVVEPEFPPPPEVPDAPQMPQVPPEPVDEVTLEINLTKYFQQTFKAPEIPEAPEEFPSSDEEVDQDIYLPAKELFDEVNKWMTKGLAFFRIFLKFTKFNRKLTDWRGEAYGVVDGWNVTIGPRGR